MSFYLYIFVLLLNIVLLHSLTHTYFHYQLKEDALKVFFSGRISKGGGGNSPGPLRRKKNFFLWFKTNCPEPHENFLYLKIIYSPIKILMIFFFYFFIIFDQSFTYNIFRMPYNPSHLFLQITFQSQNKFYYLNILPTY